MSEHSPESVARDIAASAEMLKAEVRLSVALESPHAEVPPHEMKAAAMLCAMKLHEPFPSSWLARAVTAMAACEGIPEEDLLSGFPLSIYPAWKAIQADCGLLSPLLRRFE